jgi:cytochrome d ubiquinol oxidase subunit II
MHGVILISCEITEARICDLGPILADVLRGVPLNAAGYFFLPLWTNWQPGIHPGILDWYTVISGLVALMALSSSPSRPRANSPSELAASSPRSGLLWRPSPSSASPPPSSSAQPVKAFLSSCLYLFFMLSGACWGLYPTLLPATTGADCDITPSRCIFSPHTLGCFLGLFLG